MEAILTYFDAIEFMGVVDPIMATAEVEGSKFTLEWTFQSNGALAGATLSLRDKILTRYTGESGSLPPPRLAAIVVAIWEAALSSVNQSKAGKSREQVQVALVFESMTPHLERLRTAR